MCATPVSSPPILSDPVTPGSASPATQAVPSPEAPAAAPASVPVVVRWRGSEAYQASFDAMREFTTARTADTPDELWLVEHPPVFTLGQAGKPEHLLVANSGIPLVQIDRGGQITYHGPGQVVAYLLLDLRRRRLMVRELVTLIEQAVIETLAAYNLAGERKAGAPGIYVSRGAGETPAAHAGAKVAALGLKIRNGCSYHGVSLNVAMDLKPFLAINPCGYAGLETVDMATLGVAAGWRDVAATLAARLIANLDANLEAARAATLAQPHQPQASAASAA
ncbi:lipoyl(octanoyl) transferase LipB [Paraburkholderia caballeronis]|uniref:lipoyl(octanoyl) transferase LipB n=1 Tax=Paraburkholderia caballeronis TaxID=416943 RepID=UPI00106581B5|nr:lipoyl(octanoyl) transferase LipB [Paraburkholderia caballeronis]TDV18491.1 lipoyl(octanoyl) transferase [Paraburkholderia caballeronis]TDV19971.1 lipoyl(octanoyl) transferase [Paraburkholderia caballeronis]TDV28188.1 lipoyl(octanoyl) transferase [Paraburkholderia caballeronis]